MSLSVRSCKINILHMQLEKVKAEIDEYSKNPQHLLLEAVHSAGYSGSYGNSLAATEATVNRLNSTVLEEFVAVSVGRIYLLMQPTCFVSNFYYFRGAMSSLIFFFLTGELYCSSDCSCCIRC